jgi:hypothetical protein
MTPADIAKTIAGLKAHEEDLVATIKAAQATLVRVRAAREAMELLAAPMQPAEFEGKLTDACRLVLRRNKGKGLTAMEVRAGLKEIGYTMPVRKNQMAYVHAVLKRMAEPGKDVREQTLQGTKHYSWVGQEPVLELTTNPPTITASANAFAEVFKQHRAALELGPTLGEMFKQHPLADLQEKFKQAGLGDIAAINRSAFANLRESLEKAGLVDDALSLSARAFSGIGLPDPETKK